MRLRKEIKIVATFKSKNSPQGKGGLPLGKKSCKDCPMVSSTQMVVLQKKVKHRKCFLIPSGFCQRQRIKVCSR